jgi:hypothetical protein
MKGCFLAGALIFGIACGGTAPAGSSPTTGPSNIAKVLLDANASAGDTTREFTAPGAWDMAWSYDCTGYSPGVSQPSPYICTFDVKVFDYKGSLSLANRGFTQKGTKNHGVAHYQTGGTYFLLVDFESKWAIRVSAA